MPGQRCNRLAAAKTSVSFVKGKNVVNKMIYNGLAILPLIVGIVANALSSRVTTIWARGGGFSAIDQRRHIVWSAIGALSFPAQLVLWGATFFVLWWPTAIALILICVITPAFFVTQGALAPLTIFQPMLNFITVAVTVIVIWLLIIA
jgi:hypothetical protein